MRSRIEERIENVAKYIDHVDLALECNADETIVRKLLDISVKHSSLDTDFHALICRRILTNAEIIRRGLSSDFHTNARLLEKHLASLTVDRKKLNAWEGLYISTQLVNKIPRDRKLSPKQIQKLIHQELEKLLVDIPKMRYADDHKKIFSSIPSSKEFPYALEQICSKSRSRKRLVSRVLRRLVKDGIVSDSDRRFKLSEKGDTFRKWIIQE